ncbi:MAG TPA: HEAT repeat domain-containing protein, partial [Sandaracinaceae bacterium]
IVPHLRRHLREDRDWRVRASSGRAIGRLAARDAVPDLVRALRDPVVDVRVVAAAAIWRLPDPAAVPALLELLRDRDASARQWAALALGVIRDRRATRPLVELLRDPEPEVHMDAIRSLGRIRDASAGAPLERCARDAGRTGEERLECVGALAALDGPEKVDALVRLARDGDVTVRTRAVQSLGRVGDALVIPALRERRAAEPSAAVRGAIDEAIREIQSRAAGRSTSADTNVPLNLPPLPE